MDKHNLSDFFKSNNIPFKLKEPLCEHTTFKIGGNADFFCIANSIEQLKKVFKFCLDNKIKYYILGKGSNILFSDSGFDGVIIHIGENIGEISISENILTAQAGALLSKVCTSAQKSGLSGLEFAYGIPGNIGGAIYMNAGAYGGEVKDVLISVSYIDENGEVCEKSAKELELGYRTSIFERKAWCILSAKFELKVADKQEILSAMQGYSKQRVDKQPLDKPSAGSTFKRPIGEYAGALIDKCGLRGYEYGGAQISTKHCGFVVNKGNATCNDVLALTDKVCEIVKEKTGITLEKEIRVVE